MFRFSIFQAGYLGVDIFFVVSGFLMTKIIVTGLDKNSFSVWKFWKARAKRICPALFFMLCLFTIVSYLLFTTDQLLKYVRQVQWALLFISNLRFAHRVDYFAENDLLSNVLLHCWSLSVEWQFYILYPFLLIFISKYFKNWRLKILCLLFVASFITSLLLVPNSAYYYLQSRAWELLAGGIVFLLPQNKWQWLNKNSYIILLLFILVICFSPKDWNSISALFIVLLTSVVIYINKKDSFFFDSKIVQYLGKISYSLYLYHWPIVCFYVSFFYFSYIGFLISFLLIFTLASLSYLFIEKSRSYGYLMLSLYILLVIYSTIEASAKGTLIKDHTYIVFNNVFINTKEKNDISKIEENKEIISFGEDKSSKILLIGDSNARHYATFMFNNFNSFYSLTLNGTLAYSQTLWKKNRTKEEIDCYLENLKTFLKKNKKTIVFLSNRWTLYFLEQNKWNDRERTLLDIDKILGPIIKNNSDDFFIVVGVTPVAPRYWFNNIVLKQKFKSAKFILGHNKQSDFIEKKEWELLDNYLKNYFGKFPNINYISPLDILCKNRNCKIFNNEGNLLFFDNTHFSKYGSNFMEPFLLEAYKKVNDKR